MTGDAIDMELFARELATARLPGIPGHLLLRFAGAIAPDDLVIMSETIEAGCEQPNLNEW